MQRIFVKLANRQDASLERLICASVRLYGSGVDQYVEWPTSQKGRYTDALRANPAPELRKHL